MKKYVFFCVSFHGISGGPSYINNKSEWLASEEWNTYGFCGYLYGNGHIMYQGLMDLNKELIPELTFCPSWFNITHKERVINRIKKRIDFKADDEIVIESNSIILAEWGEIISSIINAKHIVYLIGENLKICDDKTYKFLSFKYGRDELFAISSKAIQNLFAGYVELKDADRHFWDAMSSRNAEQVKTKVFDKIPEHDWMITHFGRYKNYFNGLLPQIASFALNNKDKKILFVIVGDHYKRKKVVAYFEKINNICVVFFCPMIPIPQCLFDKSDVVISTAGCACISFRAGAITISMDVENMKPLGVMGYTTREHTFRNDEEINNETIEELLSQILIEKRFTSKPPLGLNREKNENGYDYHISFAIKSDGSYYDEEMPSAPVGKQQKTDMLLVKMGLSKVAIFIHIINHLRKK